MDIESSTYRGPVLIGYITWPSRGTTYHFEMEGHNFEIYITKVRKKVRVFVDHIELRS